MALEIDSEIRELVNRAETVKVLSLHDDDGNPHSFVKTTLRISPDGVIEYHEFNESSKSYKYFTRALWFDKKAAVTVIGQNGENYLIKGKPMKIIICGSAFEKNYSWIRKEFGDVDLAAVCLIEPEELIIEPSLDRLIEVNKNKPIFTHLDRLASDDVRPKA